MTYRIGVIVEQRYLSQAQPSGMIAAIRARSHRVEVIDPEAGLYTVGDSRWLAGLDLIVVRGRSLALQFLLRWAEEEGITTINRGAAIAAVCNKADMAVALAAAGIPTPATFFGPVSELAAHVPGSSYPLILKPVFGDNCRGLQIAHSDSDLSRVEWPEPVALAQHFVANEGYDLKLYGIGKTVSAVRKPSPLPAVVADSLVVQGTVPSHPVAVTPAMEQLAYRCAETFGLELYGIDCIETPEGLLVIEVNDFPNYTAVDDADEHLAEYVLDRTMEEKRDR